MHVCDKVTDIIPDMCLVRTRQILMMVVINSDMRPSRRSSMKKVEEQLIGAAIGTFYINNYIRTRGRGSSGYPERNEITRTSYEKKKLNQFSVEHREHKMY